MRKSIPVSELIGRKFGRWTIIGDSPKRCHVFCRCDCGTERSIFVYKLYGGNTRSCGCQKNAAIAASKIIHGQSSRRGASPEYWIWGSVISRCHNPASKKYPGYGGRGITVCAGWRTSANFLADMGKRPSPTHSIDRIDNDGGYWCGHCAECVAASRPANCRWATLKEQSANKRTSRYLEYSGERLTVAQWAERLNVSYATLYRRVWVGWSDAEAIEGRRHAP